MLVSINIFHKKMIILAVTFIRKIRSLPFTNLGLLLGTTKLTITNMPPIMSRSERRLLVCSSLLSLSGRIEMVNSTITPITIYAIQHKSSVSSLLSSSPLSLYLSPSSPHSSLFLPLPILLSPSSSLSLSLHSSLLSLSPSTPLSFVSTTTIEEGCRW